MKFKNAFQSLLALLFLLVFLGLLIPQKANAAYLNITGFETGDFGEVQSFSPTSITLDASVKRTGSYSMKLSYVGTGEAVYLYPLNTDGTLNTSASIPTLYTTFYLRPQSYPSSYNTIFGVLNTGGSIKMVVVLKSNGVLAIYGRDTNNQPTILLGTGSTVLSTGNWYRIEVKVGTGSTGAYELKINGVTELSGTADLSTLNNTRIGLGVQWNYNVGNFTVNYDDISISDSGYSGDGQVNVLKPDGISSQYIPDGNGFNGAGTPAYTNVNEVPPNGVSYWASQDNWNRPTGFVTLQSSATGGVSGTIGTVKGVTIARKRAAGVPNAGLVIYGNNGLAAGTKTASPTTLTTSWTNLSWIQSTDPNTSSAWTTGGLDAAEIGYFGTNALPAYLDIDAIYAMVWNTGVVLPTGSTTSSVTNPNSYYVTLNGSANPNGVQSYGHFRIYTSNPGNCNSDSDGVGNVRVPAIPANDYNLGSGTNPVSFTYTTNFTNGGWLSPNATYYYCAYGTNTNGFSGATTGGSGGVVMFATPDGPAHPCDPPLTGDLTVVASCALSGTQDGLGSPTGKTYLQPGVQLTINAGQTVARGSSISINGGSIIKAPGGVLTKGAVYMHDTDGDGVPDDSTRYVGIAPPGGYVVASSYNTQYNYSSKLSTISTFDCDPASSNLFQTISSLVIDSDLDGYKTAAAANSYCVGGQLTNVNGSGRTYYRGSTGAPYYLNSGQVLGGGATDCDDTTGKPCQATGGSATGASQTSMTVSWSAGTGPTATSYDVVCVSGGSCSNTTNNTASSPYTHSSNPSLVCGTSYTYNIVAKNASGSATASSNFSGSTTSCASAPSVTTNAATSVTPTNATLNGTFSTNGGTSNVYWFKYGTTNTLDCNTLASTTSTTGFTGTNTPGAITISISSGQTYYFCAFAQNNMGTNYGSMTSFPPAALLSNGSACSSGAQCSSGNCYVDGDADRYAPSSGSSVCQANTQLGGIDCDDTTGSVNPGVTAYFSTPIVSTGPKNGTYDYNCTGIEEKVQPGFTYQNTVTTLPKQATCTAGSAPGGTRGWVGTAPNCGQVGTFRKCSYYTGDNQCSTGLNDPGYSFTTCSGGLSWATTDRGAGYISALTCH